MNAVTVAPAEPQAELMEHQRNPTSGDAESSVFGVETCPTPRAALSLNNPTPNRAFYGLPDLHVVGADLRSPLAANTGEPRFTSRPLPPSLGDPLCRLMLGITSVTRRLHPRPPTHPLPGPSSALQLLPKSMAPAPTGRRASFTFIRAPRLARRRRERSLSRISRSVCRPTKKSIKLSRRSTVSLWKCSKRDALNMLVAPSRMHVMSFGERVGM